MTDAPYIGAFADNGETVDLHLKKLTGSHMAIAANSGGGKSGLTRVILEQTHGQIQHIILDAEDEFYTLRERYPYVIAGGEGGDIPISTAGAGGLAVGVLENNLDLIVQLNDFKDRDAFIGSFLKSLVDVPQALWRPVLIVIDEAQRFIPQQWDTSATGGILDLLQRGRKRGFTAVLCTPRLQDVSKMALSPVNNWMIGRAGQPVDRRMAADIIGFGPTSAEARNLQSLDREFYGYGPAITNIPRLFKVRDALTAIIQPGDQKRPTPPASGDLAGILKGLLPPAEPVATEKPEKAADGQEKPVRLAVPDGATSIDIGDRTWILNSTVEMQIAEAEVRGKAVGRAAGLGDVMAFTQDALGQMEIPAARPAPPAPSPVTRVPSKLPVATTKLPRAVEAIASFYEAIYPRVTTFSKAAQQAGVGMKSSMFRTYEPSLVSSGRVVAAEGGYRAAKQSGSPSEYLDQALAQLSPAYRRIFNAIRSVGAVSREEIITLAEISPTSSTTSAALRDLTAGLEIVEQAPDGRYRVAEIYR